MLNSRKLKAVMVEHGDRQQDLAKYLGISENALSNKITRKNDFVLREVKNIIKRYNLTAVDIEEIFFK